MPASCENAAAWGDSSQAAQPNDEAGPAVAAVFAGMRAFIAIEIPAEIRIGMAKIQDRLKQCGVEALWVRPEGAHLTLKFLGDVEEARKDEIINALGRAAACVGRFRIAAAGAGVFPDLRSPRVIWLGLAGDSGSLAALHKAVEEAMGGLGFGRDDRKFIPHLTLARIRRGLSQPRLRRALEEIRGAALPDFEAARVSLIKSVLMPSGAVYTEIGSVELGRQAGGECGG